MQYNSRVKTFSPGFWRGFVALMENSMSEEGNDFSDAREDFSTTSCESESTCSHNSSSSFDEDELVANSLSYDLWAKEPIISIDERRHEFIRITGLDLERWRSAREEIADVAPENVLLARETSQETNSIVRLKVEETNINEEKSSSMVTTKYGKCVSHGGDLVKMDGLVRSRRTVSDVHLLRKSCKIASSPSFRVEEIARALGIANWVQQHFKRRELVDVDNLAYLGNKERKDSWLKKLSFKVSSSSRSSNLGVHVNPRKKQWKELSGLYLGQEFDGHKGNILAMKFSPDGRRLATGGQDGVVLVWEVVQDDKSAELDVLGFDQSCLYVSTDGITNVDSFHKREDGGSVRRKLKKSPERACIISPKKFFRILETPLHDFHEHEGAVLDISWSDKGLLLSASVDKTVRLWQLGHSQCIRAFSHHDFVTCVQFNPVNDDFFISGSIDGKVRFWSIPQRKVVHWIDIKEIVTAICYKPDGKGAIAGTILGNCFFYDIKDNHLHLDAVVCLEGKRSTSRRINSFQFSPRDSNKVMVTSGDSQVRILSALGVVCKFKGFRNGRKHLSGSFTIDGKYVVSASADSNVYIWNCSNTSGTNFCYSNNEMSSCENFISENALIAVPWHGYRDAPNQLRHHFSVKELESLSSRLSEMVLPSVGEIHMKLFKDVCQRMVHSDMWGLVIVTGGSDGRIRAYHNYGLPVHT